MALDLYAGPLSRYHSGDWETIGQQMARLDGVPVVTIRVDPQGREVAEDDAALPQQEVTEAVHQWRDMTCESLSKQGLSIVRWTDEPGHSYLTDRPGWEGLAGLIYKFAYLKQPTLKEPSVVPSLQLLDTDPAFAATIREPSLFTIVAECEMWFPGTFEAMFGHHTLTERPVQVSSVHMLNLALDQMCELWGKDRNEVEAAETDQPAQDATLDAAAIHGLAVFCRLARFAQEQSLPLLLDY